MRADSIVRARIPKNMKEKAALALHDMGMTSSDLIRLVFMRVAEEGRLPFPFLHNPGQFPMKSFRALAISLRLSARKSL